MEVSKIQQAVILAGGYGTRLKPFTDSNPKPMYPFEGKPFLEYLIEQVASFGIRDIVLLLGYLPEKIMDYFGDGSRWGVNIRYSITPVEYETGLRLRGALKENLLDAEFLLMYCDNYCPIDYRRLCREYFTNQAMIQFTAYRNTDHYTKSNLRIAENGLVEVYDKSRTCKDLQGVDIGYAIVNRDVLNLMPDTNENFEKIVYPQLVQEKKMYATITEHRYYSVGSWERIELTKEFFSKRKFIFLDRDGTMNVRPPRACYIEKPDDFIWLPDAKKAIQELKNHGYQIILVSNQPGIARGRMTENDLACIHEKMQADLKSIGASIDYIYYCPHNWDEGCECRKPKPGMFYQAQRDLSLDLTKCWMLGDDERDMHAGGDAGCRCMYITEQHPLLEAVHAIFALEEAEK